MAENRSALSKAHRPRVLVLHPELELRAMWRTMLQGRGFSASVAQTTTEALECISSGTVSEPGALGSERWLVVLEWRWPNSKETVRQLRALKKPPCVVALSTRTDVESETVEAGVDRFCSLPIDDFPAFFNSLHELVRDDWATRMAEKLDEVKLK
jgi:DNA-binding response OmpR family regulator